MAALNLREAAYKLLERLVATIESKQSEPLDPTMAQEWLHTLEKQFDRFTRNNDALMSTALNPGELDAHIAMNAKAIDIYHRCVIPLRKHIAAPSNAADSQHAANVEIKLDPLAIPSFDGEIHNWLAFKDVFETLVHNVNYPDAYKLGKLRGAVSGSVRLVGANYSGGYQEVWNALKLRYDNRKLLAETHTGRFMTIKPIQEESQKSLFAVIDAVEESLRALEVMGLPVRQCDVFTVPIVISKLPYSTKVAWGMACSPTDIPSISQLLRFLGQRAQSLATDCVKGNKKLESASRSGAVRSNVANTAFDQTCAFCKGDHRTMKCPDLISIPQIQRFAAVKAKNLCHNCLKDGHYAKQCSSSNCRGCGRKHHTLLCQKGASDTRTLVLGSTPSVTSPPPTTLVSIPRSFDDKRHQENNPVTFMAVSATTVLLATARVLVLDDHGEPHTARALCDPGSQVSFVTERMANVLRLPKRKHNLVVEGIGGLPHARSPSSVNVTVRSRQTTYEFTVNALVLPTIVRQTPPLNVNIYQWAHLVGLPLADPHFGTPGGIDVLLGADIWGLVVEDSIKHGNQDEPHAQSTRLGWVVFGPVSIAAANTINPMVFNVQLSNDAFGEDMLVNIWNLTGPHDNDSMNNDECERIFSSTHSRTDDGRYVVHIPLKRPSDELGGSYAQALRQFKNLERRLAGDAQLRSKYTQFMAEYASLGHMEKVDDCGDHRNCYYIPHHAVINKFRVVFNASARTTTGLSLNDIQRVGPTIQESLINIILRFRRYQVALAADIEKMFRQVLVADKHRDLQRILWRESPTAPLAIYRLTTVTYGMASSPYNAVRTLHQCAHDNLHLVADYDAALIAKNSILSDFYVDDWLTSCDDETEAITLGNNVDTILRGGHFQLRKWNSNEAPVLKGLTMGSEAAHDLRIGDSMSILGIIWHPSSDMLFFNVNFADPPDILTKRHVLSEVAKLFDPTGVLSPVVVRGRIFIQTLWSAHLDWDDPFTAELESQWRNLKHSLEDLPRIRVPRWLGMRKGHITEIYGFCDASLRAYAAALYARTQIDNHVEVMLMAAATKVAPLRGATIPRLELCAAQLLSTLLYDSQRAMKMCQAPYHLFTDSQVVLCWIRKDPALLKPYVANRVQTILKYTSPNSWRHIRSSSNPADCASRGLSAAELIGHHLWWYGPSWLKETQLQETCFPATLTCEEEHQVLDELRATSVVALTKLAGSITTRTASGQFIPILERFSSLHRILHIVAYLLRWIPRNRSKRSKIIDARENDDALLHIIRLEQGKYFGIEIDCLLKSSSLSNTSSLLPLNPFLGEDGLIRVGGRIGHAALPMDRRFPIIIPRSSSLARLLISQIHQVTLHGGTQLMLQVLRSRFWILRARQVVRSYVQTCVICRRHRGATLTQQMASLPWQRVNASRPFKMTGVDYCGPFTLRIGHKRSRATTKTYVVIFICMATKAVHIDVAEDLSANAFLDVFTRFISRRGPCSDLYSDNGTAFVGAHGIMKQDLAAWNTENSKKAISNLGTSWHFITPSAPHQGGIWEAAVKSAKYHLVRVVGGQSLWYGQLLTLTARIEACLNSRPIVPLHDDPDDRFALTPGDFLIGAPLLSTPEPSITDIPANRVKHWQWLRRLHQEFWNKWNEDYLSSLQTRSKWRQRSKSIEVGDIVLIKGETLPPSYWRMGRVIAVHPGRDGLIRNATIQTATGHLTRAVQKLCVLLDSSSFEPTGSTGQDA